MKLKNLGSLITVENEDGSEQALGYLFSFQGKGVFSPDGKVEISKENADAHNAILDAAMLKGLDENCAIGQRGTFYFKAGLPRGERGHQVTTWLGTIVAGASLTGKSVTFSRAGKVYRGRLQADADCFNFRRVK